jgi:hypothetical protein
MKYEDVMEHKWNVTDKAKLKCWDTLPLPRAPTLLNFSCCSPVLSDTLLLWALCFSGMWSSVIRYTVLYVLRRNALSYSSTEMPFYLYISVLEDRTTTSSRTVGNYSVSNAALHPRKMKTSITALRQFLFYDTVWRVEALYTSLPVLEGM